MKNLRFSAVLSTLSTKERSWYIVTYLFLCLKHATTPFVFLLNVDDGFCSIYLKAFSTSSHFLLENIFKNFRGHCILTVSGYYSFLRILYRFFKHFIYPPLNVNTPLTQNYCLRKIKKKECRFSSVWVP